MCELTKVMKGVSHTDPVGEEFSVRVMKHMRETVNKWKAETGLGFALYGTPAESLCYRFARVDKERFGDIEDITDNFGNLVAEHTIDGGFKSLHSVGDLLAELRICASKLQKTVNFLITAKSVEIPKTRLGILVRGHPVCANICESVIFTAFFKNLITLNELVSL